MAWAPWYRAPDSALKGGVTVRVRELVRSAVIRHSTRYLGAVRGIEVSAHEERLSAKTGTIRGQLESLRIAEVR